jgi:hypothetical protein
MSTPLSMRTVCCKLAVDAADDAALRQTQAAFNAAASYCAAVAWVQGVTNKNKLHYLVYGQSRVTYGLGAQLACCARDKVAAGEHTSRSLAVAKDRPTRTPLSERHEPSHQQGAGE